MNFSFQRWLRTWTTRPGVSTFDDCLRSFLRYSWEPKDEETVREFRWELEHQGLIDNEDNVALRLI